MDLKSPISPTLPRQNENIYSPDLSVLSTRQTRCAFTLCFKDMKTVRNIAIILGLAAILAFAPSADRGAELLSWLLSAAFLGALAFVATRLYQMNRFTLLTLTDRLRVMLYGACALIVLILTATGRLWNTGLGSLVWILALAGSGYVLYRVYLASREY